jgi:hypothetical protein
MWFILFITQIVVAKTFKVLAIRVEFQKDSSELTTGDGTFDLREIDSLRTHAIDPPPHNRWYFEDHLTFLRNYYLAVSNGQVEIEFQCFPLDSNSAYKLDKPMFYYNPYTTLDEVNQRLVELVRDAFNKAIEDPAINIADFDAFVLFHAGVGQDIEVGLDETPKDIPSLYITSGFIQKYSGTGYIELNDGSRITGAAILPETESQAGFDLALNGMLVSQFASFLGMPDLINNKDKKTAVGIFDLMDVGLFNLSGLLPSIPMAWHRIKQGWVNPVAIQSPEERSLVVYPYDHPDSSVYQFPLTTGEYFLVEMRKGEGVRIDSLLNEEVEANNQFFNYRYILQKFYSDQVTFSPRGVLIDCKNYDLGIPGKGILIWHVDENRITTQLNSDAFINDDDTHRGIDLEEADGSQDIGESFGFLSAGAGSENGYLLDMWYNGNNAPMYRRNNGAFSPNSLPSSNSYYANAYTGLTLFDFSDPADTMHFKSRFDFFEAGYPLSLNLIQPDLMRSFPIGDTTYILMADDQKFAIADAENARLIDEKNLPIAEKPILLTRHPSVNHMVFLTFPHALFEVNATDPNIAFNPVYQSPNSGEIRSLRILPEKGFILLKSDSVLLFSAEQNSIHLQSGMAISDSVSDVSWLQDQNSEWIVVQKANAITLYDMDFQNEMIINIPSDLHPESTRLFILNGSETSKIFLYDSNYVYLYKWLDEKWEKWYESETGIKDFAYLVWTENNIPMPAICIVDHQLNLFSLNGILMDYFPLMEKRYAFKTTFTRIVGTFFTAESEWVLGVYANGVAGKEEPVQQTILSFYSLKGKPLYHYFLPLGKSDTPFSVSGRTNSPVKVAFITNPNQLGVMSVGLNLETFSSYNSFFAQQNYNDNFTEEYVYTFIPELQPDEVMPVRLVYNWPNPVQGNSTRIRFWLNEDADVEVTVFDEIGKKVFHTRTRGVANMNNEIELNCAGYSPGVYFATVRAVGVSGKETKKVIKIAVLK